MSVVEVNTPLEGIKIVFGKRETIGQTPIQIRTLDIEGENKVVFSKREVIGEDPTYGTNWPYQFDGGDIDL